MRLSTLIRYMIYSLAILGGVFLVLSITVAITL